LNANQVRILTYLLLLILLSFYCQNLFGQYPNSNYRHELNASVRSLTPVKRSDDLQNEQSTVKKLKVVSSFFPIGEFVKRIGGNRIDSSLLVPVGTEPHDFEPTIKQIQNVSSADVLVYNGLGMENWIDKMNVRYKIDASSGLKLLYSDKNNKTIDPHVWVDPELAKREVQNIRDGLIRIDHKNRDYYTNNTSHFLNSLDSLDKEIRTDLLSCKKKDFIAFHNAFSYFAKQYGLNQHSIFGTPEAEVTPQHVAEIINTAKSLHLNIIYSEELIDPRYASVVAKEIPNGKVLVLSPIEGLTRAEQASGIGYLDKMQENVKNLMEGLECH
jgi:zinc transport system substrate-binding protein